MRKDVTYRPTRTWRRWWAWYPVEVHEHRTGRAVRVFGEYVYWHRDADGTLGYCLPEEMAEHVEREKARWPMFPILVEPPLET